MDAFVEEPCQAPMFRKRKLLYLYCLDREHVFELTVPSLPFLKLKCLFGHVSFPGALSERRIVVFPQSERTIGKVKDVVSPCVIEVTSSVDFQVGIFLIHVITVYVKTAFFFSRNSFHDVYFLKLADSPG